MVRLPFMILRVIPHVGGILRGEAATDSGARARSSGEELTPADDQAVVAAALATLKSRDGGFDLVATTRGIVRAPRCGAALRIEADGSCAYCRALVLAGGRDWVVWSIEEAPW
jgi:hypothetical protein